MFQTHNRKGHLLSDSRFDVGDVLAIKRNIGKPIILEVQRPDSGYLKGRLWFRRLSLQPANISPWPDEVYENDPVIVIGKVTDSDIADKLRPYGAQISKESLTR